MDSEQCNEKTHHDDKTGAGVYDTHVTKFAVHIMQCALLVTDESDEDSDDGSIQKAEQGDTVATWIEAQRCAALASLRPLSVDDIPTFFHLALSAGGLSFIRDRCVLLRSLDVVLPNT